MARYTLSFSFSLLLALLPLGAFADAGPKPARPNDPILSFPLEDLGFEQPAPRFLVGGYTMYTVHFVDSAHILLTFNVHGLIPRMQDAAADDEDRLVAALLLELPSGQIVARTTWHTRDREQYLWPLSHGLFMLRVRSCLTVIDPVRNLASGNAFREQIFLDMHRRIGYISVAPTGDLLVVETVPSRRKDGDVAAATQASVSHPGSQPRRLPDASSVSSPPGSFAVDTDSLTEIHFFRLLFEPREPAPMRLIAQASGVVASHSIFRVPATSDGFLDILKESPQTWDFDFQSHAGKRLELAPFDTTCAPSPWFISRSQFVAFGCRGNDNHLTFSGFNFRGEQPWIQALSGQQIAPFIISSPESGRFAFSRILLAGSFYELSNLSPEEMTSQEILILQHHDGRILLKVQASPIQRAGQNCDLSSDGTSFALIRNNNLEIYKLPALTAKDREELKRAATDAPEPNSETIRLASTRTAGKTPTAPASALAAGASGSAPSATSTVAPVHDGMSGTSVDTANALTSPATAAAPSGPPPAATTKSDPPVPEPAPEASRPPPSLYTPEYPKTPPRF